MISESYADRVGKLKRYIFVKNSDMECFEQKVMAIQYTYPDFIKNNSLTTEFIRFTFV